MQTIVLDVEGMTCGGCAASVKRVVQQNTGAEAEVDLDAKTVTLPGSVDVDAATRAIEKAGFEVKGQR